MTRASPQTAAAAGHQLPAPHPDPNDLYRRARVQQPQLGQPRVQGRRRASYYARAAADRARHLRGGPARDVAAQSQGHGAALRHQLHPLGRHLLLRRVRQRHDPAHRQGWRLPLLHLLDEGPAGRDGMPRHVGAHGPPGRLSDRPPGEPSAEPRSPGRDDGQHHRPPIRMDRTPPPPHCRPAQAGHRSRPAAARLYASIEQGVVDPADPRSSSA